MSSCPSHFATTIVATALPNRFVMARASLINRSIGNTSTIASTGILPDSVPSVAASVIKPPPVTAAAPFDVSSNTPRISPQSLSDNGILSA